MLFGKRLKKRVIGTIGLSAIAIIVQFLDSQRPQPIDLFSDLPDQNMEPDYYSVNSLFKVFDTEGRLDRTLQAGRLVHYPETEQTLIEQPLMSTFSASGTASWLAKGELGQIEGDGDELQLRQNVVIWKPNTDTTSNASEVDFKLLTDAIHVDFKTDQAHTQHSVELISKFGNTQAIGFEASLKSNQIKLLDQVRGTYAQ